MIHFSGTFQFYTDDRHIGSYINEDKALGLLEQWDEVATVADTINIMSVDKTVDTEKSQVAFWGGTLTDIKIADNRFKERLQRRLSIREDEHYAYTEATAQIDDERFL